MSVETGAMSQGRPDVVQPSSRPSVGAGLRWLVTNPLPAGTVVGALAFVMLRSGMEFFYREFGVEPEEVGLGYQDVLIRALPVFIIVVGAAGVIYMAQQFGGRRLAFLPWLLGGIAALALAVYLFLIVISVYRALDRVRDGLTTNRGWTVNPLGIRAEAVAIDWLGDETPTVIERCDEVADGKAKPCAWVFLGRANGAAVLYEATNDQTVRLPDSEVVMISQR